MEFSKKALFLSLSIASAGVLAQGGNEKPFYLGLKAGSFMIDVPRADDASAFGVQAGYDFGQNWALEFEYNSGTSTVSNGVFSSFDIDTTTLALYGAYRSSGKGYFLAKIGVIKEKLEASAGGTSINADDTGAS